MWHAIERSLPELKLAMSWAHTSTPASVSEHIRDAERDWEAWTGWDWAIFYEDQIAGSIGLIRHIPMWRSAELGYWIRSDIAGRGVATEAGRAAISFGFEVLDLNRIELGAAVDNIASQRVAEKLGFVFEGTKREGSLVDGRGVDTRFYGLLASDPMPE